MREIEITLYSRCLRFCRRHLQAGNITESMCMGRVIGWSTINAGHTAKSVYMSPLNRNPAPFQHKFDDRAPGQL